MDDSELAVSQIELDEDQVIQLTGEQAEHKQLYQGIIDKVSSLSMDAKQVGLALELLPIFQHNDENTEKREAESILMLLDFAARHHSRVMAKEPIRSKALSLIQSLQDYGKGEE